MIEEDVNAGESSGRDEWKENNCSTDPIRFCTGLE